MAVAKHSPARLPRTLAPALLVSMALSVLCAGALYYILAQHDRAKVSAHNETLDRAAEDKARATARTFAWFTERLLGENVGDVQRAIDLHLRQAGVLDAAVIAENNIIVAAKSPNAVGQRVQDSAWMTARTAQSEVTTRGIEMGRPAVTVVEPLRDRDHIVAWVRLVFTLPQDYDAVRSADDLAVEVALYIIPLFVLMSILVSLTLRGILSQVRVLIARVVMEAFEPEDQVAAGVGRLPRLG